MAENTGYTPLPADLPEDWTPGQTIAPAGADVGLSEQHGYNYLNAQVNAAQRAVNQLQENTAPKTAALPAGGTPGQVLGKTGAEDYQAGWQDPVGRSMAGQTVEPTKGTTVTAGEGAEVFNDYRGRTFVDSGNNPVTGNVASGKYSHAEGEKTTASGAGSHAEGSSTTASGTGSHAEGSSTTASGTYSHAEGSSTTASGTYSHAENSRTEASGQSSHAEGDKTVASNVNSHAEGSFTTASGRSSHAEGNSTVASGFYSHAGGEGTIASGNSQCVVGSYNVEQEDRSAGIFIVGKGNNANGRANALRVQSNGVYASGNYNASGADYAELFEWLDGNPDQADRCGRFVTLDGEKIRLAGPDDDYILGIVSGNPSVLGDVHDDQWQGMYLYDVFGRPLWEDVEVPAEMRDMHDPENPEHMIPTVIIPAHTEHRQKLNPAYDNAQTYLPRSQRPEWDAVGMLGKLVAVDDGTCQVNGWCKVGEGGVATRSETRTKYRVMARLDETHVRVLIL